MLVHTQKYTQKTYTQKMIDNKLASVIYRRCENLTRVIFHHGKLSERTRRKATGLKVPFDREGSVTSHCCLILSKPGCRGDNNQLTGIIIILDARLFYYNHIKSIPKSLKVIGVYNLLSNINFIIVVEGGAS